MREKIANLTTLEMEGAPPIFFRKGTSDEIIIQVNLGDNPEYEFPASAEPKVIFDCGANIGVISVLMANIYPDAKIYAFEPEQDNFEILKMNTEKYPNIKIYNFGLGAKSCEQELFMSDDPSNFGGFSLHSLGCNTKDKRFVQIVDIAQFIKNEGVEIDMIKIDTEGAEHEILTSMALEQLKKVTYIFGELHGTNDFQTLDYLQHNGFVLAFMKPMRERVFHFYAQNKETIREGAKKAAEEVSAAKA